MYTHSHQPFIISKNNDYLSCHFCLFGKQEPPVQSLHKTTLLIKIITAIIPATTMGRARKLMKTPWHDTFPHCWPKWSPGYAPPNIAHKIFGANDILIDNTVAIQFYDNFVICTGTCRSWILLSNDQLSKALVLLLLLLLLFSFCFC